jgi:hypothetical protein
MLGEIYQQYGFHPDSSGEKVYLGFTSWKQQQQLYTPNGFQKKQPC